MVATVLLGYGESHVSYETKAHDMRAFAAAIFPARPESEDVAVQHTRMADLDGCQHLINDVQNYLHRHPALANLSPVEMTMAFAFGAAKTKSAMQLMVKESHPLAGSHGHNPRFRIHLAKFISPLPLRPEDDGDADAKEAYASVILANFFPYNDVPLRGETKWEKLRTWREDKPRGALDDLALRMVDNAAMVRIRGFVYREFDYLEALFHSYLCALATGGQSSSD